MPESGFLSLGSNLGDRESNLASAITALSTYHEINDIKSASFYNCPPLFNTDQAEFLNTVIAYKTDFSAFDFFDACRNVEKLLGRPDKREKNSPRTIDIDILTYGSSFLETEQLTIPHSDLANRKFVLVPWAELDPDFTVPVFKMTVTELLSLCPDPSNVTKHVMEKNA
jgi:2-amino-4-hydroxy-6-hydroxymethyldihydropteridine diphosphokinase|tara:strand:+ start:406 stop:912 length:507 start_codon:yes stop_codon:yes gene_type:complete